MINNITKQIFLSVIEHKSFSIYFQPIININKKKPIGYEALFRATYKNEPISAEALFNYARKNNQELILDSLSHEETLRNFTKIKGHTLLFMNFETSLAGNYLAHLTEIVKKVKACGLTTDRVVIEINEKRIMDNEVLVAFVNQFRSQGFLIALDDIGEGHSNLNRIALTQPDIVKMDRYTIDHISQNYYKKEIFRAITTLISKLGAVVIAEGVENIEDLNTCVSLDSHLFQGYYFSKAITVEQANALELTRLCQRSLEAYSYQVSYEIKEKSHKGNQRKKTTKELSNILRKTDTDQYPLQLNKFVPRFDDIECIYVLDSCGKQISPTIFHPNTIFHNSILFNPAGINDFHIEKAYYYFPLSQNRKSVFISDPYISSASGNFCKTYSCVFSTETNEKRILCIDFKE